MSKRRHQCPIPTAHLDGRKATILDYLRVWGLPIDLVPAAVALDLVDEQARMELAIQVLEEGCDSLAMADVAGGPPEPENLIRFLEGLNDLGLKVPDELTAVSNLLHFVALANVNGQAETEQCIDVMVGALYRPHEDLFENKEFVGDGAGLHNLVGAYWGLDDIYNEEVNVPDRDTARLKLLESAGRDIQSYIEWQKVE